MELRAPYQRLAISTSPGEESSKRATLLVMRSFLIWIEVFLIRDVSDSLALPKDIDKLTRDVKGVEKTVILVEQNPAKYSHIDAVGTAVDAVDG